MSFDTFARVVADLAGTIPAGQVAAWSAVLRDAERPGTAVETALIDARPGYAAAAPAHRLVAAWRTHAPELPGAAVALALRSAAETHRRQEANRTVLAVSGPSSPSVPVRLTSSVVVEVIRSARHSLLVVSFAAYGVPDVVRELDAAAGRGVTVDLVLEDTSEAGGTLRGAVGAAGAFTLLRDRATFWHWPAAGRHTGGRSRAALHAKVIAADRTAALISSANLTDRALSHNLEIGVVIRDPQLVERLVTHFTALMDPATGQLRKIPAPGSGNEG